jgi:hypothetical protein
VQFKWSGGPVAPGDFGLPTSTTTHELCVFSQTGPVSSLAFKGGIPPGGTCGTLPCWKTLATGYKFVNKSGSTDGMTGAVLKNSPSPGRAKIRVLGKGSSLALPTLPFDSGTYVTAELRNSIGQCWGSPPLFQKQNDPSQYKGRLEQ